MPDPFDVRLELAAGWRPGPEVEQIRVIDAHTAGEPLRIIFGGGLIPAGDSILDRRRAAGESADRIRTALMWEPRGHADMYGCLIVPPATEDGDFGVLFLHNEGYSTMCGHGIIAVTKVAIETGLLVGRPPTTEVRIDTPAGRVTAFAEVTERVDGRIVVDHVRFRNVPSFVQALDLRVEVPGLGTVTFDLAYGGAFYAYVSAAAVGVDLRPENVAQLIDYGRTIKSAVASQHPPSFPESPELAFLYGTIFVGPPETPGRHSRNVCIFADGEVDRSPTGTGVSGRLAILHARGELAPEEEIEVESILGTSFTGQVLAETRVGSRPGIVPEVGGRAFVTGICDWILDPSDPLRDGFLVR